jgi:hypothetical protein
MFNYSMTVNSTGNDETLVAKSMCQEIFVGEAQDPVVPFPSVDWQFKMRSATTYVQKLSGTTWRFHKNGAWFEVGEIIADLKTPSGSAVFDIVEQ